MTSPCPRMKSPEDHKNPTKTPIACGIRMFYVVNIVFWALPGPPKYLAFIRKSTVYDGHHFGYFWDDSVGTSRVTTKGPERPDKHKGLTI